MATTKVSALSALTTTDGAEELLINDGGTSKKVTIANLLHDESIDSDHYVDESIDLAHMSSESVDEDNLHISNAGSNGQFLSKQSGNAGGLTWASVSAASTATSSATGVIKLEDDTEQTTAANTVSATVARTYGLQLNGDDQGVVNVPWTDTNTNQLTTFTVSATTDSNATTISQGDDLMIAAGTGITAETTADGTVTITNTVSDTNTTYSAGSLLDLSTTTFNVDLTELTDGTADVVGSADELVYLDDGVQKRKQIDEIKLGQFNNDQSWANDQTSGEILTLIEDAVDSVHYVDASIDNAHLADNAVDTEEIADNAVTLAKMAGGTDGNIISYDSSGDPVAIATGSDGQILTSAGAGAQPAFEDAPQGVSNSKLFYYGSFT